MGENAERVRGRLTPQLEICYLCFQPAHDREMRGGVCPCQQIAYCSRECRDLDWRRRHRFECVYNHIRAEDDDISRSFVTVPTVDSEDESDSDGMERID